MYSLLTVSLLAAAAAAPFPDVTPQYGALPYASSALPYGGAALPYGGAAVPYLFEYFNPSVTDAGEPLFESDMVLTAEQRADRKAAPNLWPGAVKFAITASSEPDRTAIEAALDHWRERSCVTFAEVDESFSGEPHLRFTKLTGCWSYVGRVNFLAGQNISIGEGCTGLGTIVHEIGHALGFNHEQSRPDRDTYVTIQSNNIVAGREGNFDTRANADNYSVPYDYTSVMHYGPFFFTSNGLQTITVNDLVYSGLIGQRDGLSHRDKQLANLMYQCAAGCTNPPVCENGGYVGKTCSCVCPPGTSCQRCQTVTGSYYGEICGDQQITQPGTITSLNWPDIYPPGKTCVWIVTAPAGQRVRMEVGTAKVLRRSSRGFCDSDWISLYEDDDTVPDRIFCNEEMQSQTFVSTGNRLALVMSSYAGGSFPSQQTGFTASVTFV